MRILFMGTPDFAVPCFDILRSKYDIVGAFTKIDKPNMRGKKIKYTPVKEYALEHEIPIYQPNSLKTKETQDLIRDLNPDLIVVVAYGKILPKEVIDIPKYGVINVHSSLLPKYRGAAPINAALIHGEEETGVSIMYIAEELDAGDVILTKKTKITDKDNFQTLHDRLRDLGAQGLLEAVELIEQGKAPRYVQDHNSATFVKPFSKDDCKIDWSKTEREIFNFVRGMNPFPAAFSICNDKIFKIYAVEENFKVYEDGVPGQVVDKIKKKGLVVKTGNGSVVLTQVKPENKKVLTGVDIMNGNILQLGDRFE
ncbi:methionyl-tRNA formyltransferase [Fusobacterium hominis]|uniref:Methionyl-tRNA formyltransferase n=1 Tax=Fusobacterium hominis TaxID=2764326 RepID=A0A7G9GZ67_9FUSO|nr:methionyl-tRNA formyltransferase [Fusobacterium hominis]QNM16099.1 methionyl-tRNA formyltransferase [Fusobacterium hominis]